MITIRGVVLQAAKPAILDMHGWPMRFRSSSFRKASVPLYINGPEGKISTIYEAHLTPRGTYYALHVEMPDGDEDAELIADYIASGWNGVKLDAWLESSMERWHGEQYGFLDVFDFKPRSISLERRPPADGFNCWFEIDSQITYKMPRPIVDVLMEFYEATDILPEPEINAAYQNYGQPEDADLELDPRLPVNLGRHRQVIDEQPAIVGTMVYVRYMPNDHNAKILIGDDDVKLLGSLELTQGQLTKLRDRLVEVVGQIGEAKYDPNDDPEVVTELVNQDNEAAGLIYVREEDI